MNMSNSKDRSAYYREYHQKNKAVKVAAALKWREENGRSKEDSRSPAAVSARLKYRFGITLDEYNAILVSQNGGCAICGQPPGVKRLHVDHDHATGKVRGVLCGPCNHALGLMKDDPERLRKAATYIEQSKGSVLDAPFQF